jgi:cellulose synthase/poly-beta-1,6-N-acetylglucosamine synthase-like glycosyltransferase
MILKVFWVAEIFICFLILYRLWLGGRKSNPSPAQILQNSSDLLSETVCVQLPLFNERGQIFSLLEAVCLQEWPNFKIQVLDDSDCPECIAETLFAVKYFKQKYSHLEILLLKRTVRTGFKAGALNSGLKHDTDSRYFTLFDCDFRPQPQFLSLLMSEFKNEINVAAVQAPWSYLNAEQNSLTRLQQVFLGTHFHIEHKGRQERKWVLNFNGTAGIWKKEALEKLGGWSDKTVTEDLLLSYQAELNSMRIRFTQITHCPSELPARFSSFLVQQRRWARGHGQVLRLMAGKIMCTQNWSIPKKIDALFHLHSYNISLIISLLMALLPVWISERSQFIDQSRFLDTTRLADSILWLLSLALFTRLYSSSRIYGSQPQNLKNRIQNTVIFALHAPFISFMVLGSYLRGVIGSPKTSSLVAFERTPKSHNKFKPRLLGALSELSLIFTLSAYLFAMALICYFNALWIASGVFLFQSFTGIYLMLQEVLWEKKLSPSKTPKGLRSEELLQNTLTSEAMI